MTTIGRVQRNPSTGRIIRNSATGRVLAIDRGCCFKYTGAVTPSAIDLTISSYTLCGCTAGFAGRYCNLRDMVSIAGTYRCSPAYHVELCCDAGYAINGCLYYYEANGSYGYADIYTNASCSGSPSITRELTHLEMVIGWGKLGTDVTRFFTRVVLCVDDNEYSSNGYVHILNVQDEDGYPGYRTGCVEIESHTINQTCENQSIITPRFIHGASSVIWRAQEVF